MKKKNICIFVFILIFALGIICSLYLLNSEHGDTVNIIQNGEIIYTIDLSASEDRKIEVEYQGRKNIIQIYNHQICVSDADCPDQICMKTGYLKSGTIPIVCLPNKLIISYTDDSEVN